MMISRPTNPSGADRAKEVNATLNTQPSPRRAALLAKFQGKANDNKPEVTEPPWEEDKPAPVTRPTASAKTPAANDDPAPKLPANTDRAGLPTRWLPPADTDFSALPSDDGGAWSALQGDRITQSQETGDFDIPRLNETLKAGTSVFAGTGRHLEWIRWENKKVVERKELIPGQEDKFPKRSDLQPPPPADPKEMDMWSLSVYLYMVDPASGEPFTFTSNAKTARIAVNTLLRRIAMKRVHLPGAVPLIRLDAYEVEQTGRRAYWTPEFRVVGWIGPDGNEYAA
jgi:hypothetical protein